MKRLVGGLLLVSAISSWVLQAAQDEQLVTLTFVDGKKGQYPAIVLDRMVVLSHLMEDLDEVDTINLSVMNITKDQFDELKSIAVTEQISPDVIVNHQALIGIFKAGVLLDPLNFKAMVMLAKAIFPKLNMQNPDLKDIFNQNEWYVFTQALYAAIEDSMDVDDGVIKNTAYLKQKLGVPEDQPLVLFTVLGVGTQGKGLQKLIDQKIKQVIVPDSLSGDTLKRFIEKEMFRGRLVQKILVRPIEQADVVAEESFVQAIKDNNIALVKVLLAIYGRVLVNAVEPAKLEYINSRVRVVNQDRSVLFLAIDLDRKEIVRLLLQAGADKDEYLVQLLYESTEQSSKIFPGTPLSYAVWKGRTDIVKMLIDAGANLSLGNLLFIAMDKKRNNIVKMLLDAGVPMHLNALDQAVTTNNEEALKMLLDHGANVNIQDGDGVTPLMRAVIENNRKMVQVLLQVPEIDLSLSGTINVWAPNIERQEALESITALSLAQYLDYRSIVGDITKVLLAKNLRNQLIEAVSADVLDFDKIQGLLEQGADIYAVNDSGVSPIDVADAQDNAALDYLFEPYKKSAADNAAVANDEVVSGDQTGNSMVSRLKKWWQGK